MRNLSLSYIIETGWNVFRKNILSIMLVVIVVTIPVSSISYFLIDSKLDYESLYDSLAEIETDILNPGESQYTDNDFISVSRKITLYIFLTLIVSSLFIIVKCSVMKMTENTFRGNKNDFNSVFETGFTSYPKSFLTVLLMSVLVALGFLFCFVPGFLFLFVFFYSEYSVVLGGKWGRRALHDSSLCTRKYPLLCFLAMICTIGYELFFSVFYSFIRDILSFTGILVFITDTVFMFIEQFTFMFPVCCLSVLFLSIKDEISGISTGGGVVVNDTQYPY